MKRLDERVRRAKRNGKIAVGVVLIVSLLLGVVLVQALTLAQSLGRDEVATRATFGIGLLIALNAFSIFLAWRQHQILDSARSELEEIVRGPLK